jgi:hypothetical protein
LLHNALKTPEERARARKVFHEATGSNLVLDWSAVLSSLVAQAPLVALALVSVYFMLKREIERLKRDIEGIRVELGSVWRAVHGFNETLIEFLAAKGIATEPERVTLRGFLTAVPPLGKERFLISLGEPAYMPPTFLKGEEVRRRLLELLEKDDVTVEDLRELDRISDLIYKEYLETGREDLGKYYYKLRAYIALLAGLLRSKARQKGAGSS